MDESSPVSKLALGDVMRVARARRRWTQRQLAEASGLNIPHLSQIENGKTDPRLSTLERIASALGLTVTMTDKAA